MSISEILGLATALLDDLQLLNFIPAAALVLVAVTLARRFFDR